MNPTKNLIEPKPYMNPTKNLIEPKPWILKMIEPYMNPNKNLIEPKPYMNPTKNLIEPKPDRTQTTWTPLKTWYNLNLHESQ